MSNWKTVTPSNPCIICGKPDWCATNEVDQISICRRVDDGTGTHKIDASGVDYWVYPGKSEPTKRYVPKKTPHQQSKSKNLTELESHLLNQIYGHLLSLLDLSEAGQCQLRQRGLTDSQIAHRQYRTFPLKGRAKLARNLVETFGEDVCRQLPGLFLNQKAEQPSYWSIAAPPGLLVPVRNLFGQIVALKIRRLDGTHPKYLYLSSLDKGGKGPGAPVHIPLSDQARQTVRLTEGELKADVATDLSSTLTISIPGISSWRKSLGVLKDMGCRRCHLAFDMDAHHNFHVARALKSTAIYFIENGLEVLLETWDPNFKGIDDCLLAGEKITLHSGGSAIKLIQKVQHQAKQSFLQNRSNQ